jgi:hypothetical protein
LPRSATLNFSELDLLRLDLSDLGHPITEEEEWEAIRDLSLDKVPGPDGFTGRFYRSSWFGPFMPFLLWIAGASTT